MSLKYFTTICVIFIIISDTGGYFHSEESSTDDRQCFCELKGNIDDCSCNVDTVDHYNNHKIYPRLKSLLVKDYFRFYKTNLRSECPFWADDSKCSMKFCSVQACHDEDIPAGLKGSPHEMPTYKYSESAQDESNCDDDLNKELSYLNTSISKKAHEEFQRWTDHDEAIDNFCILDDKQEGAEYVDLLLNPERYTGYRGESAHRIWKTIYMENCFLSNKQSKASAFIPYTDMSSLNGICMEQRAFYRLISGLHSSINIHLCANYLLSEKKDFVSMTGIWGHNLGEFVRRFSSQTTDNEGSNWLRNLYFAYIVELRALAKASHYLRNEMFFTGFEKEDKDVQAAVNDLLTVVEGFPSHFNESQMFNGGTEAIKLKNDFRDKFRNISKTMDCVGCDKCRLWGKLQTQGLGTALKILFSGKFDNDANIKVDLRKRTENFKLQRTEIVSLFNAFGRLSQSIYELEIFRKMMR